MLFNSYAFIFLFLPVALAGFFGIGRRSPRLAALWLAAASLFFYGWWDPRFVPLLLGSVAFNYGMGYALGRARSLGWAGRRRAALLAAAVAANLLLLAYYKYTPLVASTATELFGARWPFADVVLPLGISFFTFTQLAFLVDVHRGIAREYDFVHYLLFVTYFPHLIAGPVLHHKQMMPQFELRETYRARLSNIEVGLTVFTLGLFKKVILADQFALYADPVFDAAATGGAPALLEAWIGALAYALQIYFDFSGYSDMAIGLSRLFNVDLPLNFDSPYKAASIIEFWRRWHMTLSAFLRDYLYFPLGGNRRGKARRYANLMATMLLGGLWHGAGWNFVLWGGLHGAYLAVNHLWRELRGGARPTEPTRASVPGVLSTFCLVVVAWVPFRATSLDASLRMLRGMFGANGISPHAAPLTGLAPGELMFWLPLGLAIVWGLPNLQQWMGLRTGADAADRPRAFAWRPSPLVAVACGLAFALAVLGMTRTSPFLYFQF